MVGLCTFAAKGLGSIPGWGIKILKTIQAKKKKKREREWMKNKEDNDGNRKCSVKLPPSDTASVALVLLP